MNELEISREARRQSRLERLLTNTPRCPCCGETDDRCFELHHVIGKKLDPNFVIAVCANCHKKLTDMQKEHPVNNYNDRELDILRQLLLGAADMLELLRKRITEGTAELDRRCEKSSTSERTAQ